MRWTSDKPYCIPIRSKWCRLDEMENYLIRGRMVIFLKDNVLKYAINRDGGFYEDQSHDASDYLTSKEYHLYMACLLD